MDALLQDENRCCFIVNNLHGHDEQGELDEGNGMQGGDSQGGGGFWMSALDEYGAKKRQHLSEGSQI